MDARRAVIVWLRLKLHRVVDGTFALVVRIINSIRA
jgi:hypothetical protein